MTKRPGRPTIVIEEGGKARAPIRLILLVVLIFIGFVIYHDATPLYTDWLWFGEVGYRSVFSTIVIAKTTLFFLFGSLFFLLFYGNLYLARKLAPAEAEANLMGRFGPEWGQSAQKWIGRGILGIAVFCSLWAGRAAVTSWQDWLNFRKGVPFHLTDPVFNYDVSFYVFRLPMLNMLYEFLLSTLALTFVCVIVVHIASRAIESWAGLPEIARSVRAQILALLAALALVMAFGTRLSCFDLLNAENGVFTGAGYVDLHYRLPALNTQAIILAITALLCLVSIRASKDFRWPVIGTGAWLLTMLLFGNIAPVIGQKISVEPNQLSMEREYIKRNIAFTRSGFGLEKVQEVGSFPADLSLNSNGIEENRDTLDNVRLWDYDFVGKVYSQLQTIKPYYKFAKTTNEGATAYDIDIDRYQINGKLRQVMLATREMDVDSLPASAQTWQNRRLAYTHGYGIVMSPVNKIIEGAPDYFISGLPLTESAEAQNLKVTQPDIYYSQLAQEPVFVDTAQQEFDYPSTQGSGTQGTQDHYTNYAGRGGIRIGDAPLAKWAFSLQLGDALMLLQNGFKPETRILYRRDIRERLQTIAPFLQQDRDPYMVIEPETGHLVWIIDCYTISDRYPYGTLQEMTVNPVNYLSPNYIRNSIKATIDAYDGTVNLYLVDPHDPIAQTYAEIYPGLLKPFETMPKGLLAHLRYPEDLFLLQRSVYATYHVDDPRVFYQKEDAWAIPNDPNGEQSATGGGGVQAKKMEPYYVIMRLPDLAKQTGSQSPGEEFLLMSPLAPVNREDKNILGWMCARCDPGHYGDLVLYRFPQNVSVDGPSQIIQLINSDRIISPQLSLLRSGGSTATFGNLLVIPIEKSLLYIAPLYVEASVSSSTKLPQLQKVVVAFGQKVVMEDTLDKALLDLFPGSGETPPNPSGGGAQPGVGQPSNEPVSPALRTLIEKANTQYEAAQTRLKAGDFAGYGTQIKEMAATLAEMRRTAGSASKGR